MSYRKNLIPGKYKIGLFAIAIFLFAGWIYMAQAKNLEAKRKEGEAFLRRQVIVPLEKKPEELTDEDFGKVTNLNFTYNKPFDMTLLEKFTKLQSLSLNDYNLFKNPPSKPVVPKWKSLLAKLHIIDLDYNESLDLKPLGKLTNLQFLSLSGSMISSIEPLVNLINLKNILLDHTMVSELEPLRKLVNLQMILIDNSKVKSLEPIKSLKNLKTLCISSTPISNLEPINGLTNLERLVIQGTLVSDIEPIKRLKNLKTLDIQLSSKVTREQEADLKKALPNTEIHIMPVKSGVN